MLPDPIAFLYVHGNLGKHCNETRKPATAMLGMKMEAGARLRPIIRASLADAVLVK
jgi:hypothetical protein